MNCKNLTNLKTKPERQVQFGVSCYVKRINDFHMFYNTNFHRFLYRFFIDDCLEIEFHFKV